MLVRRGSPQQREPPSLRLAGLILRRRSGREFHSYIKLHDYVPADYEVLLRTWPSEPFTSHLGAFSGPMIAGQDPEETLLRESMGWTRKLAEKAGLSPGRGVQGRRAVFLSVHGGGKQVDPVSRKTLELGVFICYVVPLTHNESVIVSRYPESSEFPRFYNLASLLRGMVEGTIKVHPYSREMLSALDHWLRERHAVPGAINALFAPSLQKRLKMYVPNPLFDRGDLPSVSGLTTPSKPPLNNQMPLLSSTPFSHGDLEEEEDSTLRETTAFTMAQMNETYSTFEHNTVDVFVKNPLYGSELTLNKVNRYVTNEHFGKGVPDYQAAGVKRGKWMLQIQEDSLPDWVDLFPLHKCACEGDSEGVKRCIRLGIPADERDSDSWAPLHYACWYGELDVVKVLVEEGSAAFGIQNSSGSTPLHLAAATGHTEVVSYLLNQRGMEQVKVALDDDGKSPLAVCLECKMNDWRGTEQLLREAYKKPPPDGLTFSAPLLRYIPPSAPRQPMGGASLPGDPELSYKGSQANLEHGGGDKDLPKKKQTLRRQRVNLMNGQHQVVHFFRGRETPASEAIQDFYRLVRLPSEFHSLFSLWITSESLELQLGDTDKPLKLIAAWNSLLVQYAPKGTTREVPELYLRRNVFFPLAREKMVSDTTALEFLYADAQRHVLTGYYPTSEEYAIALAGISMQIAHGDYNMAVHQAGFLKDRLEEVLPSYMATSRRRVEFERKILARYAEVSQMNVDEMQVLFNLYLKYCWRWPFYGAAFYNGTLVTKASKLPPSAPGRLGRKSHLPVRVGVNTVGFHIVNKETNAVLVSVGYHEVEWDVSAERQELVLHRRDKSLNLLIHTKKARLIYRVVARFTEQYLNASQTSTSLPPSTSQPSTSPPTPSQTHKPEPLTDSTVEQ